MRYKVEVIGLEINGHPVVVMSNSFSYISTQYDILGAKYPEYDIVFTEIVTRVLKDRKGISKVVNIPEECPKGHKGQVDGRSILRKANLKDRWSCTVCGEIWEEF